MELALSLGDARKPFSFLEKSDGLGLCMPVSGDEDREPGFSSSDPPVQLDLLPFSPVHRTHASSNKSPLTWLNEKLLGRTGPETNRDFGEESDREGGPPSFFQMGVSIFRGQKRDFEQINNKNNNNNNNNNINEEEEDDRGTPSRGSDEEEIGRKKLRLSKEQSAFLEQSFKEHSTLNPKQKISLAKELNLRPRQVEVWFQNRRARTKLKQTEVDCEYLKKCRDTLTEENRRLQKELHELRALKASKPFYMQLPATTLTMCPSCERVATTGAATAATVASSANHRLSLSSQQATS